jgi:Uncharacterized conserved protein
MYASILTPFFAGLSLEGLVAWAGEAVFKRGTAYHKDGRVRNAALTPKGGLLATVDGTRKYATVLCQETDGKLASSCTCPYGARCKHAVALACVALDLLAKEKPFPLTDANDKRLLDLEIATSPNEASPQFSQAAMQKLEAALQKRSKPELLALILNAVRLSPEVATLCAVGNVASPKDALSLVKDARKALRKALEVPDWGDSWRNPDYELVRKKLETLRLAGFAKEVLDLGFELIEDSVHQIELYDDEGEIMDDVAQCMPIVLHALRDVAWPMHEKLIWAADAILADAFAVCECFRDILHEKHVPETWSPVADALLLRVEQSKEEDYSRRRLIDMTTYALTAAGREAELYAFYTSEAVMFGDYLRLVQYLLGQGNDKDAEKWIHKGIAATKEKKSYLDEQLRSCLLNLRKNQKDWDAVLCMQTENFVRRSSLDTFHECRHSAEKLKVWAVLRPLLMAFLIERTLPWQQGTWPCRNRGDAAISKGEKHPDFGTLIDLAIHEKNPTDVLKWYDLQCKTQRGFGYNTDRVATAVQDFAPERSITLWKKLAEAQIAVVNPKAYVEAAGFLRKIRKLMDKQNMTAQWNDYIRLLRTGHRRKIRFMEVLDSLSSGSKQPVQTDGRGNR